LNDRQIEIIAGATPKRDYYFTSPNGNRLFSLALGEIGLAYCAATGDEDIKRVLPILGETPEDFNREYLAMRRLEWVPELMYPKSHSEKRSVAA
jgi:type IV secretion system protein VirB4